jgi:hypothetical protein
MYELKKIGKVFTSKLVGTGPSSYEKRIYQAAVSQRLRNPTLDALLSGKKPLVPTNSKAAEGQSRSGGFGEETNHLPGIELRFLGLPALSLVTLPSGVPQLPESSL